MADTDARAGPAGDEIRAAITAADGAIGFDEFVRIALYGEHGFYTRTLADRGGSAGRRGDFITSSEVGPLFGAVVARFLDAEWERLGRPDPFTVVDAGAGPGTLARTVLAAHPACGAALRYVAVETSAAQRERHPHEVGSRADLPTEPFDGVVLANELLDNIPFRLAVYDGGWREAFVTARPDGTFAEVLSVPFDPLPARLPARATHGARAPIHTAAAAWVDRARTLVRSGTVVVFDYASPTTAALAVRPFRDWLRTYRDHERGDHPLVAPGSQDITTEVALDQLPEPDAVRTQSQWLQLWGIDDLVAEGRRHWAEHAARPDLAAIRMRSRVSESEALLDPAGLGTFTVAEWHTP
ncbi:MAG: SAM-dependent methyltransferase [Ilumatobacteraceae bacterium]